jgi:hypothetical protein
MGDSQLRGDPSAHRSADPHETIEHRKGIAGGHQKAAAQAVWWVGGTARSRSTSEFRKRRATDRPVGQEEGIVSGAVGNRMRWQSTLRPSERGRFWASAIRGNDAGGHPLRRLDGAIPSGCRLSPWAIQPKEAPPQQIALAAAVTPAGLILGNPPTDRPRKTQDAGREAWGCQPPCGVSKHGWGYGRLAKAIFPWDSGLLAEDRGAVPGTSRGVLSPHWGPEGVVGGWHCVGG